MNMNNLINILFGELNIDFCYLFMVISALSLFVFVISGILLLLNLLKVLNINKYYSSQLFYMLLNSIFVYFINRLYYSMCIKTLK